MKIQRKTNLLFAASIAILLAAPLQTQADSSGDLVRISDALVGISDDLSEEFAEHYRNSRNYGRLVSDIRNIRSQASRINALARNRNASSLHIERSLDQINRYYDDLRNQVDLTEDNAGSFAYRLFGDTRHVFSKLSSMNNAINSLERAADRYERNYQGGYYGNQYQGSNGYYGRYSGQTGGRPRPVFANPRRPVYVNPAPVVVVPSRPVVPAPIVRPPSPIEIHKRIRDAIFGRRRH